MAIANKKARSKAPAKPHKSAAPKPQPGRAHTTRVRLLVGGVNSPVRAFRHVGGEPVILTQAQGAEVVDQDGRTYLDFISGWGAIVLGHNHPAVVRAVREQMDRGMLLGLSTPAESQLAQRIVDAVPSVEQLRCTASGTEACMTAVRLARAHTGRTKILLFEGGYHGHSDSLMAGLSAGIPETTNEEIVRVPYNDLFAFEKAILRHATQLACVILEPVAANMGVVLPGPGILTRIREVTAQAGILLIFDEVVTGFRLRFGAVQTQFNVTPDLTTFGKIIGGGLPIGAVGGARRIMQRLAPEGDVYHGGTFAGYPLSMAGGVAALDELQRRQPYEQLDRTARQLADGLVRLARKHGIPLTVNRAGSMFSVFFSPRPVRSRCEATAADRTRFAQWARHLREHGILIPPSPYESLFVTAAHTDEHVARVLEVSKAAFQMMRNEQGVNA